jgi:hypothetical protein
MVGAIVFGFVVGGLFALGLRSRATREQRREARRRERLAAIVLCEEMQSAIDALDMALRDDGSKWLVSMSQSTTLTEAWDAHAESLLGLGPERWVVINDAVSAVAPTYSPVSDSGQTEHLKRSLPGRRARLVNGAEILRSVRDRRGRRRSLRSDRIRSLLV